MKPTFHPSQDARPQRGFTIIELLIVIVILGVLAALAAPSFSDSIKRYRVGSVRDSMTASIQWARSEAIRRRLSVGMVRTTGCGVTLGSTGDWSCGWEARVDANSDGDFLDAGDTVLQSFSIPIGFQLLHTPTTDTSTISRFGQPATTPEKFLITPPEGSTGLATTTVCFKAGGRVTVLKGDIAC